MPVDGDSVAIKMDVRGLKHCWEEDARGRGPGVHTALSRAVLER